MPAAADPRPLRVALVDPSGYSRPYDHELASALAAQGGEVTLHTSAFAHGDAPRPDGYRVCERFYRRSGRIAVTSPLRRPAKAAEHPIDLAGLARALDRDRPDVVHVQWAVMRPLERRLYAALGRRGMRPIYTAHDPVPHTGGMRRARAGAALARAFAAVIVHSRFGRDALVERLGVPADRVHVVPHGVLGYLRSIPPVAVAVHGRGPLAVLPGIIRPYKGADVLLEAWPAVRARVPDARLVVAGRAMMDLGELPTRQPGVTLLPRFLSDGELAWLLRAADAVVLPYRTIDSSGVVFAALAFDAPLVLSDVGGFAELGRDHGVGRLVPPDDPAALADALAAVLGDTAVRADLAAASRRAADTSLSWADIAARTEGVYRAVLAATA